MEMVTLNTICNVAIDEAVGRHNRLKFKTSRKLSIHLEGFTKYPTFYK